MFTKTIIISLSASTICLAIGLTILAIKILELDAKRFFRTLLISLASLIVSAAFVAIVFRIGWMNFIDNYEIGYQYDLRSGKTTILNRKGYVITPPIFVNVHTVDLRPVQVCISTNARVLNCKLVQFDPKGLELFLSWHGRADYSIGNSRTTVPSTFAELLKTYAYDGSDSVYPFLRIIKELKNSPPTSIAVNQ